jgi:hypothetical protein
MHGRCVNCGLAWKQQQSEREPEPIDASAGASWLGEQIFGKQDLGRRPGT